jgi:hypothetical protein
MKEHKLFVIASLLLSRAWATTLEDALASDYADCYDPSGTCSCTSIDLHSNSLTGTIPASLANCSALTDLELDGNSFTGTVPAALGSLSALKYLCLDQNLLTGTVPASLGSLSALDELRLWDNSFTGELPKAWCNITLAYSVSGAVECADGNNFACSSICPSGSGPCDLTTDNCCSLTDNCAGSGSAVSRATSLAPGVGAAIACACAVLAMAI